MERIQAAHNGVIQEIERLEYQVRSLCKTPRESWIEKLSKPYYKILASGLILLILLGYYLGAGGTTLFLGSIAVVLGWFLVIITALSTSVDDLNAILFLIGLVLAFAGSYYLSGGSNTAMIVILVLSFITVALALYIADKYYKEEKKCQSIKCKYSHCKDPNVQRMLEQIEKLDNLSSLIAGIRVLLTKTELKIKDRAKVNFEATRKIILDTVKKLNINEIELVKNSPYFRRLNYHYIDKLVNHIIKSAELNDLSLIKRFYEELKQKDPEPDIISDSAAVVIEMFRNPNKRIGWY